MLLRHQNVLVCPERTIFRPLPVLSLSIAAAGTLLAGTGAAHAAPWSLFAREAPPAVYTYEIAPQKPAKPKRRIARDPMQKGKYLALEKAASSEKKPVGPLLIAVSIDKQQLKIYDANGLFAESKVSTGKVGHSTPRGVFSVIQKNKWHRSNLYSDAPMPYMQRITWSGVALHAGIVPGYPASHGCIRLPAAFAPQLWNWTRLGARVVITHGEVAPMSIAHPQLIAQLPDKPAAPEPAPAQAAAPAQAVAPAQPEQPADANPASSPQRAGNGELIPIKAEGNELGLRLTPIESNGARDDGKRTQTGSVKTADASNALAAIAPQAPLAVTFPPPPQKEGHVALYVSRKEGKLFVRRNFAPWFDVAVTIKDADAPLGTHVFTARIADDGSRAIAWTALSMPAPRPAATKSSKRAILLTGEQDLSARRRTPRAAPDADDKPVAEAMAPVITAQDALARIALPAEAMAHIAPYLTTGSSLTISDNGLGSETGQGTDFIVLAR